jgi:vitamin B12 transporter
MNRKKIVPSALLLFVTVMLQYNLAFAQDTIPEKDSVPVNHHIESIPYYRVSTHDSIAFRHITLDSYTLICPVRAYVSNPGLQIEKPDSIQQSRYSAGTLTDLLGQNGMTFLKYAGNGSLATTSIRGASASQTLVLWNGVSIESPTNGNLDLSLMPGILFDVVSLQNGGGSAGWGSGAIGGVIQAGSAGSYKEGLHVRYLGQYGSFGEMDHGLKISYSNEKYFADVRAYHQVAENNFTFRNLFVAGHPIDTLVNAEFFQQGIQGQLGWHSPDFNRQLTVRAWYQNSDRGIPPTMQETNSDAYQKDEFFRSMADWQMNYHKLRLEVKSALLTEFMDYYIGYHYPNSFTHALSLVNEADCRIGFTDKFSGTFGITDTYAKADVTQYLPSTEQNRAGAYAAFQFLPDENWNIVLNFREEEVQGKIKPIMPSLGAEWYKIKFITLKTSVSRNYRVPAFNDLYWVPGGNPDLQPEDSWNADAAVVFHYNKDNFKIEYSATAYYRVTRNWIYWHPSDNNSAVWSPENLLEVWSRGFEHRLNLKWTKNKFDLNFIAGYDYVRATNEKSKSVTDISIGKQLPYVPANHIFGMLQFSYSKFYLAYNHQFNGLRFTVNDHSEYLPAFDIANLTIGKRFDYRKSYCDIYFRVNNLFDKEYQSIAWRPMPGRNYQVGITIDFNKPKSGD